MFFPSSLKKIISLSIFEILCCLYQPNVNSQSNQSWFPEILSPHSNVYLTDFSYAGYHWGEDPIPDVWKSSKIIKLTDFGAAANDENDDTGAFVKALKEANKYDGPVIIQLPKGKIIIKQIIWIRRSNLVIRGEGSKENGSVLYIPDPMEKMKLPKSLLDYKEYLLENNKRVKSGELFSLFSWTGGIIWTEKQNKNQSVLTIGLDGKRGSHSFAVENSSSISPGMIIQIQWFNTDGKDSKLLAHIFDNQKVEIGSRLYRFPDEPIVTQEVTVESVVENKINIKEKLLLDLRREWKQKIAAADFLNEVGLEHFSIQLPDIKYGGHHLEAGYNGIYLNDLNNSWVNDVAIHNSDSGILSDDCKNVTIQNIKIDGRKSHYTLHLGDCRYMLVKDFDFSAPAYHSPSFNTGSRLNVFTHGKVEHALLDQHCGLNMQNLFDDMNITINDITKLFTHGGAGYYKPTAGAFNTFWNIYVDFKTSGKTGLNDAPSARFIGFHGNKKINLDYNPNVYIEGLNKSNIAVPSLYEYQLQKRLNGHRSKK